MSSHALYRDLQATGTKPYQLFSRVCYILSKMVRILTLTLSRLGPSLFLLSVPKISSYALLITSESVISVCFVERRRVGEEPAFSFTFDTTGLAKEFVRIYN